MRRIDIGCGLAKPEGFIGVDRAPLPGVDVVADLNQPLPFASDSIDLVYASHSLEHVDDLIPTMREIYRICRHGAQVCIVAPYGEQKLNLANPYHFWMFNEHTPRFWTHYPFSPVDPEEFYCPHAQMWGLSRSDNSNPGLDIRLVRMEFFYFQQYLGLPKEEARKLRQQSLDVCDQILYHLIVWKGGEDDDDKAFQSAVAQFRPYMPGPIESRRNHEREVAISKGAAELAEALEESAGLRRALDVEAQLRREADEAAALVRAELREKAQEAQDLARRSEELASDIDRLRAMAHETRQDLQSQRISLVAAFEENLKLRGQLANQQALHTREVEERIKAQALVEQCRVELLAEQQLREAEGRRAGELRAELEAARSEVGALRALIASLNDQLVPLMADRAILRELERGPDSPSNLKAKQALLQAEVETTGALLAVHRLKSEELEAQLAASQRSGAILSEEKSRLEVLWSGASRALKQYSSERAGAGRPELIRMGRWVIGREASRQEMSGELLEIRAYSDSHIGGAARATLVLTGDLRDSPYRDYTIERKLAGLSCIRMAFRAALPEAAGYVGVEIVSSAMEIVAQVVRPLSSTLPQGVVEFPMSTKLTGLGKPWYLRVFVRDAAAPVQVYELERGALPAGVCRYPFVLFK